MKLIIRKKDVISSEKFAGALRSQVSDFPSYLHANWDSIEASLCDYLEEREDIFEIDNEFTKDWLIDNGSVCEHIFSRLISEYSNIRVRYMTQWTHTLKE